MEEQKKEYTAPELSVVAVDHQIQPLCCSAFGCDDDAEMGLAPTSNDHFA